MAGIFECPRCKGKTQVIDSRTDKTVCNRRRRCIECKTSFSTQEKFVSFNRRLAKTGDAFDLMLKDEAAAFAKAIQ